MSDAIAQRNGFDAGLYQESEHQRREWSFRLADITRLGDSANFPAEDLAQLHIDGAFLNEFVLDSVDGLLDHPFGSSKLERTPLIRSGSGLRCIVPRMIASAARLYILEQIAVGTISAGAIWDFHDSLYQRWKSRDLPACDAYSVDSPTFPPIGLDIACIQDLFQFDNDKFLHLLFLPSPPEPPSPNGIDADFSAPSVSEKVTRHIERLARLIQSTYGVVAGMSLVVYSSPGWTFGVGLPKDSPDWFFRATSASSLACLLGARGFSVLRLWKLFRHEKAVQNTGTTLVMYPDILVHYSNWRRMGFSFFQRDLAPGEKLGIFPDTSNVIHAVREWRERLSTHSVQTVEGTWSRCERLQKDGITSREKTKPIYADPKASELGQLRGVVETSQGPWWLAVSQPPSDSEGKHFVYLLWTSGLDWLLSIAKTFREDFLYTIAPIELDLLLEEDGIDDQCDQSFLVAPTSSARKVSIHVSRRFIKRSQTATNEGDQAWVRALVRAVVAAGSGQLNEQTVTEWVSAVLTDPAMKKIHVMPVTLAAATKPTGRMQSAPWFLQEEDIANIEIGFREELCRNVPALSSLDKIEDKNTACKLLNAAVVCHWKNIRKQIESLNRLPLLELLSSLIEGLHQNRTEWERSARAMRALHADDDEFPSYVASLAGRRDNALIAYRAVAEMALCHAPLDGGRVAGLSDIDTIAARCSRLISVAYSSDAFNRDLVEPRLSYFANGEIALPLGQLYEVMGDFTQAFIEDMFVTHAEAYESYFGSDPSLLQTDNFRRLNEAIQAETKLSLEELVICHHGLDQIAYKLGTHVVRLRLSDLKSRMMEFDQRPTADRLDTFLETFSLATRSEWDKPPQPFKTWEFEPWRFERRLSLNIRPIMVTSKDNDPWIIYGIGQLQRAINYYFYLLDEGWWSPDMLLSDTARAFVADKNNLLSHEFELTVLANLKDRGFAGMQGMSMTQLGATAALGDLDVIAWDSEDNMLLAIECKRLKASRTPREVANRLAHFRGEGLDRLKRHLRRLDWLRNNIDIVVKKLNLAGRPSRIIGLLISDHTVPMSYRKGLPLPAENFVTIGDIRYRLKETLGGASPVGA